MILVFGDTHLDTASWVVVVAEWAVGYLVWGWAREVVRVKSCQAKVATVLRLGAVDWASLVRALATRRDVVGREGRLMVVWKAED